MNIPSECEFALKKRKELENLLDLAPDPIFCIDKNLRFLFVNQSFLDLTGLTREKYPGKTSRELKIPEDLCGLWDKTFLDVFRNKQSQEIKFAYPSKKGLRYFQMRVVPEKGTDGSFLTIVGFSKDITEQKEKEAVIERTKEQAILDRKYLETILAASSSAIVVIDASKGRFSYVNERAVELYGIDYLGTDLKVHTAKVRALRPNGTPYTIEEMPVSRSLEFGESVFNEEMTIERHDGVRFPILVNTAPVFDAKGKVIAAVVILDNITEVKQAKETLNAAEAYQGLILNSLMEHVIYEDRNMNILWANRAACQSVGMCQNEILGRHCYEIWPKRKTPCPDCPVKLAMETGEPQESEKTTPDGRIWLIRGYPVHDKHDGVLGGIEVTLEITEKKKIEDALKKLNENLEKRVAERTRLAENRAKQLQALAVELIDAEDRERQRISELLHEDLQQILVSVKLQLQTACHGQLQKSKLIGVEQILQSAINKCRNLSHSFNPPTLQHFGLIPALDWLLQEMKEQFGLKVHFELNTRRQFRNESLKKMMFRSVQELLFNVVKHSGMKTAHVKLSEVKDALVITISDQGRGFNPDILKSSNVKTGLGLVCLRERARAAGGSLKIKSAPGQGSKFILTMPCSVDKAKKQKIIK